MQNKQYRVQTGSDYQSNLSRHLGREDRKPAGIRRPTHVPEKDEKDIKNCVWNEDSYEDSSPKKCGVIKIMNINKKGLRR